MKHQLAVGVVVALGYFGLCSFGYFEKYFGAPSTYQEGVCALPLADGSYLVSGAYNNTGAWNSYQLGLNEQGDTTWTKRNQVQSGKVQPTTDNNLIYLGGNNAGQAYDTVYVTKTDTSGNIIWRKQIFYGVCHNTGSDILSLSDGGYLVTGFYASKSCSNPTYNSFILKLDENGNKVWDQFITGTMNSELYVLKALPDGNFAAFGWTNSFNENYVANYLLVKFDSNGNIIWKNYYGDNIMNYYGYGMDVLPNGDFVMVGYDTNMLMVKAGPDGSVLQYKNYGLTCGGTYYQIKYTTDGGLAMLGSEMVNDTCTSVLMKTDLQGNILWSKNWDATLRQFNEKSDGSFILTGYANYLPQVAVIMIDTTKFQIMPYDTFLPKQVTGVSQGGDNLFQAISPYNTLTPDKAVGMRQTNDNQLLIGSTTGISSPSAQVNGVIVYPNPANQQLSFEFNNPAGDAYRLDIYTVAGQLLQYTENNTSNKIEVDRQQMAPGVYTYKLSGAGNNYTGKFVFE